MNKKTLSGFAAFILALLASWGIYKPAPAPSPTPSPTATATATPEPTPEPLPTPTAATMPDECVPSPILGECEDNPAGRSVFADAVRAAQAEVAKNPRYVVNGGVFSELEYTAEVARVLRLAGYCSKAGLADEVWVKAKDNSYSDHFDIVTSDLNVWFHYAAKCIPARF